MHTKKTNGILQEINQFANVNRPYVLETRASHIVEASVNLLEEIRNNFSEEEAEMLIRKFYSSIKNEDFSRFSRALAKSNYRDKNE